MYHNRGNSTFAGENSEYGDFPAATGRPGRPVDRASRGRQGHGGHLQDVGEGRRRRRLPDRHRQAREHAVLAAVRPGAAGLRRQPGQRRLLHVRRGLRRQPGVHVAATRPRGRLQATLDFGFQASATALRQGSAGGRGLGGKLQQFFASDDWYTDADSNVYSLPTFLGNHDMGRIGKFLADTGATGDTLLQRDEFAHSLMYLTPRPAGHLLRRRAGLHRRRRRPGRAPGHVRLQVAAYNDDDLIGTGSTTRGANYNQRHPLYRTSRPVGPAGEAPDPGRRGAGAPLRRRRSRHLRLQPDRPHGQNVEYVVARTART